MKLVLIDRDGVINEELPCYVKSVEELVILPQALDAMVLLTRYGHTCVIITNQSVVGRGIIPLAGLHRIHEHLCDAVRERGGKIEEVILCADHPDQATYRRKPQPGMLLEALEKYQADPTKTPFIGDAVTDMVAAHAAGCQRYLVMTGKGRKAMRELPPQVEPVTRCTDILDAAQRIVTMRT